MLMTIPYAELWLLELSVQHEAAWLPWGWLPDTDEERWRGFSEDWNCPINGQSRGDLAATMWRLMDRREIEFAVGDVGDDSLPNEFNPSSRDELAELLSNEIQVALSVRRGAPPFQYWYRITATGIARWEQYADANWDRFLGKFSGCLGEEGETTWCAAATTEEFARENFTALASDPFHPTTIDWESCRVMHHRPWEPIIGKTLPAGVTVSVRATEHAQREFSADEWLGSVKARNDEFHRHCRELQHWFENSTRTHADRPKPA